ncbi:hypothetical protein [Flavobacterium sp. I3-2]|uniref:hypothetical protein n=1 Tax=Flavobacterium sp. I3-2 TaxID=2748319 RepID=UPI0015B1446B|nr:hypothetical protein [Flavobacterium sp. I3-2]
MKKLTQEQIDQLFVFTKKHLVEHYDVQVELVDHLANAIEAEWEINPNISFTEALQKEYKNFGVFGFSGLVEQKQAALQNHYWNIIKNEMQSFFTIPKIVISVALFYVLFQFYSKPTTLGEQIWLALEGVLLITTIVIWIYQYIKIKKSNKKYLIQSISNYFYSIPFTFIVFFGFSIKSNPNLFSIVVGATSTTLYILFVVILFFKIIPLIKNEIRLTEQKMEMI